MDSDSPFAKTGNIIPLIGQPQILSVIAVALLQCNCEVKAPLLGIIGPQPFACPTCGKTWLVQAQIQVGVAQVISKEPSGLVTN